MAKVYFKHREHPLHLAENSEAVCKAMEKVKTGDKTYIFGLHDSYSKEPVFFILEEVQFIGP